jgi:homocysteine S-methyltransferase
MGIQSDLMGAHALGIRNILALTGDPPRAGDYPNATAVFDVDSVGLIGVLKRLNAGSDLGGNSIGEPTTFVIGCAVNPTSETLEQELERFSRKIEAGAEFAMTQPLYELDTLVRFLDRLGKKRIPVLLGLLPLQSHRHAEFLHNEVPGMQIPLATRERMAAAPTPEAGRLTGMLIAAEMVEEMRDDVAGAYIMPQFGRYRTAIEVLKVVGYDFAAEDTPAP